MYKKRTFLFAALFLCTLLLAGCGGRPAQPAAPAGPGGLKIVTSFYPMYIATINVTKDVPGVTVVNMTKPQTGCLHDYQLTPENLRTLEDARVFVVNGAGMESFLGKVARQNKRLQVIDASAGIPLLHDQNGVANPHVWLNVDYAIRQVEQIAARLGEIDPAHKAQYQTNAAAYGKKLAALRDEMRRTLAKTTQKNIVTFHEAFPYFADAFHLNLVAAIEQEPGVEPSPRDIRDLIEKIKRDHVKALFVEPQYPAKTAYLIAAETGAKVYTLDPVVTGDAVPEAAGDYLRIMRQNLKTLQEALQ